MSNFSPITEELIALALAEDQGHGDITSNSLIAENRLASAVIISRGPLRVCGHEVARRVFQLIDSSILYQTVIPDGTDVMDNEVLSRLQGSLRNLLLGERTALNFMQRLSGIATQTARIKNTLPENVQLLDTRKTTPCMREIERYAVKTGGGTNHRFGLFDAVLIKNNHIDALGGKVADAVKLSREKNSAGIKIEEEVRDQAELDAAITANPDVILFDNFLPEALSSAVSYTRKIAPSIQLEASGGVNEQNIGAFAATGVDSISLGMLTHSVKAADISLRIDKA